MKSQLLGNEIGSAVRRRRRELNLSAHDLSALSGVSEKTIVAIEWHMTDDIDLSLAESLCNVLNVNLPALLQQALAKHI